MTDTREPTVIRGAKLYFETVRKPAMHPALGAGYAATVKFSEDIYEWFVNETLFGFRVISIVGYNPQKLLPAPSFEDEFMQSMSEWAAEQMKITYATAAAQYKADFGIPDGRRYYPLYPHQEAAMRAYDNHRDSVIGDGFINFQRNSDHPMSSAAHSLADAMTRIIKAMTPPEAPVLLVGADFGPVEAKALSYMYATFVHESELGSPTPRGRLGRLTIYDYDDRTVIELEGEGELPGRRDLVDDLFSGYFARQLGKTASMTAMMHKLESRPAPRKSYLDHDPTKRHKRRKQRGNPHKR